MSYDTMNSDCENLMNHNHERQSESDDDESVNIDPAFVMSVMSKMWNDYYPNISRDQLSREICLQKAIKNNPEFYNEEIKNHPITFGSEYPVYCRGKINDDYYVYRIEIHAALTNNLSGPHYVSIEDNSPFWVHSLTALRKKFLGFHDFVSFERSSFLTWFTTEELTPIRLKMIRQNIKMNLDISPTKIFTSPTHSYSYTNNHIHRTIHNKELSPRSALQIKRMLFNIKQIHHRDGVYLPRLYFQIVEAILNIKP